MGHSCCNNNLKTLFNHALSLQKEGNFEQAVEHYRSIVNEYPDHTESHYNLAYVLSQQELYYDAILELEEVIAQQPHFAPGYFNLAINYLAVQKTAEAIVALGKVLDYEPAHLNAAHLLACLYLEQKNYEEALPIFNFINARKQNDSEIIYNLALTHLGLNHKAEAITYFKKALEQDPTLFEAFYNIGVIYAAQQQFDLAVEAYEKCIALKAEYYPAYFNLGRLYHEKRELEKAREYYDKALAFATEKESIEYLIASIDKEKAAPTLAPTAYILSLFDSYASSYDLAMQGPLAYATPKLLRESIIDWLVTRTARITILDLGCGTGLIGKEFAPFAEKLVGIDLSSNMLMEAQNKGVYTQLETAEIIDYLKRQFLFFDMIVAADVLLYFGDLEKMIEQISRVLEYQGVFGFSIEAQSETETFSLQTSARYAHNPNYIKKLAEKFKLKIIVNKPVNLRKHNDEWIAGQVFWLQKL